MFFGEATGSIGRRLFVHTGWEILCADDGHCEGIVVIQAFSDNVDLWPFRQCWWSTIVLCG